MFGKAGNVLQHWRDVSEEREQAAAAQRSGEQNQQHLRIKQSAHLFAEIGSLLLDNHGNKPDNTEQ
ncbi:hypothetical protein D3C87_2138440 [compost metagenome]